MLSKSSADKCWWWGCGEQWNPIPPGPFHKAVSQDPSLSSWMLLGNLLLLCLYSRKSSLPFSPLWPLLQWWFEKKVLKHAWQATWNKGKHSFWAVSSHSEEEFSTVSLSARSFRCDSSFEKAAVKMMFWIPTFIPSKELSNQIQNYVKYSGFAFSSSYLSSNCQYYILNLDPEKLSRFSPIHVSNSPFSLVSLLHLLHCSHLFSSHACITCPSSARPKSTVFRKQLQFIWQICPNSWTDEASLLLVHQGLPLELILLLIIFLLTQFYQLTASNFL